MGRRAEYMKRFKAEHPVCYFCASEPTASEDHVPSRECFHRRVGPEGFGFPACVRCNNGAGRLEQVVALYILLADQAGREPDREQFVRLLKGVKNNNPSLMPSVEVGGSAARRHFRDKGMRLAPGMTYSEVPLLQLPSGNRAAMELFARRLTCALFYKEVGRPLPLEFCIATAWVPVADPAAADAVKNAMALFPELRQTNRRNTDIGDQFMYVWGHHKESDLFGFTAQLSASFVVLGTCVPPEMPNGEPHWKPHADDVRTLHNLVT